ncbi:Ger(x)C family spore germination protein [Peribacillus alkalitolerans]|uniref:Ger(x)C family spore germination protein n=1 Tax=Peribacillus alkalitolerans TaxID=1550385 RepID=UPI0013D603E6|nr:Ger(x)C family spore germination protein [Peribacillus alkalitolerans]
MKRLSVGLNIGVFVILLTGCWDQQALVDKALIDAIGLDQGKEDEIFGAVRFLRLKNKGGGQFEAKDELLEAEGSSLIELSQKLNMMMPGKIDANKAYILMIGEELAKQNIYPIIDPVFRNKGSFLGAKIMVTKGQAYNILSIEQEVSPIAFDLLEMIESGEDGSVIPDTNLFSIWSKMIDPGKDMMIPYIEKDPKDQLKLAGIALFNGTKYSGSHLNLNESTMLLLLMDELTTANIISIKIPKNNGKEKSVSKVVDKIKKQTDIKVDDQSKQITYSMDIRIKVRIQNYPQKSIKEIDIKDLNKKISIQLTKDAKEVIDIIQEANSDVLGIGRDISTKYPDLWKEMNWNEEYQKIKIEPKIKAEIVNTGTLF